MRRHGSVLWLVMIAACAVSAADPADPPAAAGPATSRATSELSNACANQCSIAAAQCEANCNRFPNPTCESRCDQRFANCMQACGCPFNHDFDQVAPDHSEATNTYVCVGSSSSAFLYRKYNLFQRTDHMRETLQCDGSTTLTVLSSTVGFAQSCYSPVTPSAGCSPVQAPSVTICAS